MTNKNTTNRYKSEAFEAIHQAAEGLHGVGAIDKVDMHVFDTSCLRVVETQKTNPQSPCLGDLLACDDGDFDFEQYLPRFTDFPR
jgi:hypothetical protein